MKAIKIRTSSTLVGEEWDITMNLLYGGYQRSHTVRVSRYDCLRYNRDLFLEKIRIGQGFRWSLGSSDTTILSTRSAYLNDPIRTLYKNLIHDALIDHDWVYPYEVPSGPRGYIQGLKFGPNLLHTMGRFLKRNVFLDEVFDGKIYTNEGGSLVPREYYDRTGRWMNSQGEYWAREMNAMETLLK